MEFFLKNNNNKIDRKIRASRQENPVIYCFMS